MIISPPDKGDVVVWIRYFKGVKFAVYDVLHVIVMEIDSVVAVVLPLHPAKI